MISKCYLSLVKGLKQGFNCFNSIYNKIIVIFDYCGIQNNQGRGRGYQPQVIVGHEAIVTCLWTD